jgi:hypothetical protein
VVLSPDGTKKDLMIYLFAKLAVVSGFEPRDERICGRREFSVLCVGRYKTEIDAETSLSERSGERSLNN